MNTGRGILIRCTEPKDLDAVVALHREYIGDSLFSALGDDFLKIVHNGIITSPYGIGYVCEIDNSVAGFIAASVNTRKLFTHILRKSVLALLRTAVRYLVAAPSRWRILIETFSYFGKTGSDSITAELLFISLRPSLRKQGVAARLLDSTLAHFRDRGIAAVKASITESNAEARSHLEKCGFTVFHTLRFYERARKLLVCRLLPRFGHGTLRASAVRPAKGVS